ncbi:MAG: cob(I)yrinic acid a,c-diamide adenosyltransferase [Clostridiales bacterium]|nr:cob(I)yrinic acid a,c-diamide adenosyltransferase [Clostridiales bacterium]
MKKGYVHVYTGNGKGKTTAALGLALRAVCAGKKVFFGQFVKGMDYSELACTAFVPNLDIRQFGRDCFINHAPTDEDIQCARDGLEAFKNILSRDDYDLVVMDELNIALYYKLFSVQEAIDTIKNAKEHIEVIITGRYAPQEIIELADLVTDMKEIKHYYTSGVQARKGIEF